MQSQNQRILAETMFANGNSNAHENPYPEYTALRPLEDRLEDSVHAARIVDPGDPGNYYSYSWNSPQEGISVLNYVCLAAVITGIAVLAVFLAKTQILKFMQFFVTHKYYKRLTLSLRPVMPEADSFAQSAFMNKLRQQAPASDDEIPGNNETVKSTMKLSKAKDLLGRVAIHATPLVQFYSPFGAALQRLFTRGSQVDTTLVLPTYVLVFQISLRLLLLIPNSLMLSLVFGNSKCFFSRQELNNSYECLNEFDGTYEGRKLLALGGLITALFVAPICYYVSSAVFKNYTAYLAKFELREDMKPMEQVRMSIINSSPSKKQKSSSKKKANKEHLKRASVSSFQALLGADSSNIVLDSDCDSSHYDSLQITNNLSASTNLNNTMATHTERPLLTSQLSERSTVGGAAGKKFQQNNDDLMQIVEDEDEQKCSPIKPKRRTQLDSPFKKNFQEDSEQSSNGQCCGAELDMEDPLGLNLNLANPENDNIIATPPKKGGSSLNQSKRFSLKVAEVRNSSDVEATIDYNLWKDDNTLNSQNQAHHPGKDNNQSLRSEDGSTLAFDTLLPGLSAPHSSKNQNSKMAQPQSVKNASSNGMIGMGLSLAMKDNRDGNLETQSQDQDNIMLNLNLSRRAELVSENGSRPNSQQMLNRQDYPILSEPTSANRQPAESEKAPPKFKSMFNEWKEVILITAMLMLLFSLCLVLYCMVHFTVVGLKLFLVTVGFSIVFDAVIQLAILIGISARQVNCEVNSKPLALDITPIVSLTKETYDLVKEIFNDYQEPNALLQLKFAPEKDGDDELLDQIAADLDLECSAATPMSAKNATPEFEASKMPGKDRETVIMEKKSKVTVAGLEAEITETTKYNPPSTQVAVIRKQVSPNDKKEAEIAQQEDVIGDPVIYETEHEENLRKKRRMENAMEKQAYFSDKKQSTTKKRLRRKSSSKKKDRQLQMSIDKMMMREALDEIPTFQEKSRTQKLEGTPEKLTDEDQKLNMAYSSSKKLQHFETPIDLNKSLSRVKKSGVKYMVNEADQQVEEVKERVDRASDAQRKLLQNSMSSLENAQHSNDGMKRLSSINRLTGDEQGGQSMSSKSILGLARQDSLQHSSIELIGNGVVQDPYKDVDKFSEEKKAPKQEKYSPIWSSVNRKRDHSKNNPIKVENGKADENVKVSSFPNMNMAGIDKGLSRQQKKEQKEAQNITTTNKKARPDPLDLAGEEFSEAKMSNHSKAIRALVSQRDSALSKQHSFNSPTSLGINLTNERVRNSIDDSTVRKRRNLVMLDEAGVSKQSLNFGKSNKTNQSSLIGNLLSGSASLCQSPSRNVAKINQTSQNFHDYKSKQHLNAQHGSQVEFDVGGVDFEEENQLELDNIADLENDLFTENKPEPPKEPSCCENTKVLPRNATKGTILVLKPEESQLDNSSQKSISNLENTLNKKALLSSQGAESVKMRETNYSAPDSARNYSGSKPGQGKTAFQRLVLASKRIIKERSSSKKKAELRSHSQNAQQIDLALNGSASSRKLQTRNDEVGFYARPFSITKERDSSLEKMPRSTTMPPTGKVVQPTAHTVSALKALADITKMDNDTHETEQSQIDMIKEMTIEQDSLDVDRKVVQVKKSGHRFEKSTTVLEKKTIPLLQNKLNREAALANPIKEFGEKEFCNAEFKPKIDLKNGVKVKDVKRHTVGEPKASPRANRFTCGPKSRKPSNLTPAGVYQDKQQRATRRPSHATENQKSTIGDKNHTLSSRERSDDSFTLDFEVMDKVREEEQEEHEKMVTQAQRRDRVEDQRRRLESFLSLARQSKSKKDIAMIRDMIQQLDDTHKPLPMSRVNDLKQLELMASPYNQSLISMIKVEIDQAKKLREWKQREKQKNKFSLPKHSIERTVDEQNVFKLGSDESVKQEPMTSFSSLYGVKGEHHQRIFGGPNKSPIKAPEEPIRTARNDVTRSPYSKRDISPLNSVRPGLREDKSTERIAFQNVGSSVVNTDIRRSMERLTNDSFSARGITPLGDQTRFQRNTATAQDGRMSRSQFEQLKSAQAISPETAKDSGSHPASHHQTGTEHHRSHTTAYMYNDHSKTNEVIQKTQVGSSMFGKENKPFASSRNEHDKL